MGETLLLVEDDVTLQETLALNLRNAGYEVVTAGDGVAALEAARQREPDLVLLDLMLPELDGLSVCYAL
jgi:DNA-binding response OmpR family regulator